MERVFFCLGLSPLFSFRLFAHQKPSTLQKNKVGKSQASSSFPCSRPREEKKKKKRLRNTKREREFFFFFCSRPPLFSFFLIFLTLPPKNCPTMSDESDEFDSDSSGEEYDSDEAYEQYLEEHDDSSQFLFFFFFFPRWPFPFSLSLSLSTRIFLSLPPPRNP